MNETPVTGKGRKESERELRSVLSTCYQATIRLIELIRGKNTESNENTEVQALMQLREARHADLHMHATAAILEKLNISFLEKF